jgi:hypothetical protein
VINTQPKLKGTYVKTLTRVGLAAVLALGMTFSANALTLTDAGVVGTVEPGTENSSVANEVIWANYLLSLAANQTTSFDANSSGSAENYKTGPTDYNGTLTGGTQISGSTDVSGYTYVLAKYDGQNAGYVLFNVADYGNTIPSTSASIWLNEQSEGYNLSHFTGFGGNGVPDGGATMLLLGAALSALGFANRKLKA